MLYSVPNVFVTDAGATVVARGERATRADDTDWRGAALRTTDLFVVPRDFVVFPVIPVRDDVIAFALRADVGGADVDVLVALCADMPLRATVVRALRDDDVSDCEIDVRFDDTLRTGGVVVPRETTEVVLELPD